MKAFFLTGSIILTILTLIVIFENIAAQCSQFLLIFLPIRSSFLATSSVAIIGIITGAFYAGLIMQILKNKPEDEEDAGADW